VDGVFLRLVSKTLYLCETILGVSLQSEVGLAGCIHRAVSKEVTMLVTFATTKGNVFIVYGLIPFFILIFNFDGS
jgi:hypothetical protein